MALNAQTSAINNAMGSSLPSIPMPTGNVQAGNPGFQSQPIPTSKLNSNEPGSLATSGLGNFPGQSQAFYQPGQSTETPAQLSVVAGANQPTSGLNTTSASTAQPAQPTAPTAPQLSTQGQGIQQQEQAIGAAYAPLVSAPLSAAGYGGGLPSGLAQNISDYQLARQNSELSALSTAGQQNLGLLSATVPAQKPLTSTLYNPTNPGVPVSGNVNNLGSQASAVGGVNATETQTQQLANTISAQSQIKGLEGNIATLFGQSGVNPTTVPLINAGIANILKQGTGNPNYQNLQNLISDLTSKYNSYLAGGGAVTESVRSAANNLINGNASPEDITTVLSGLDTQMSSVIGGLQSGIASSQNIANTGTTTTPPSGNPAFSSFYGQ